MSIFSMENMHGHQRIGSSKKAVDLDLLKKILTVKTDQWKAPRFGPPGHLWCYWVLLGVFGQTVVLLGVRPDCGVTGCSARLWCYWVCSARLGIE